MLTSQGPPRSAPWDTRSLAVLSAVLALTAVDVVAAADGRGAIGSSDAAVGVGRSALAVAAPGALLALACGWFRRRVRVVASLAGTAWLAYVGAVNSHDGGWMLVPAATLLVAAGVQREPRAGHLVFRSRARNDLVVGAAVAALAGVVGRALTLDGIDPALHARLAAVAAGLVLLGWPVVGLALLPSRCRHRMAAVGAAAVVMVVVVRSPVGGEQWLIPAVALLVVAALAKPAPDEVPVGAF